MSPAETSFRSRGTRCAARHLPAGSDALDGPRGRPCVVMAHGSGATRDSAPPPVAERFAAAGADVLVVGHRGRRADHHAAVAHARALPGVDRDRIVLWGGSGSGGHVLAVAADDGQVAAVIAQAAAVDGPAGRREVARRAGVGRLLRIPLDRPVTAAARLRAPLLVVVAGRDDIAAPGALRRAAARAGAGAEVLELGCGPTDVQRGGSVERSVTAQVDFLTRSVRPSRITRREYPT